MEGATRRYLPGSWEMLQREVDRPVVDLKELVLRGRCVRISERSVELFSGAAAKSSSFWSTRASSSAFCRGASRLGCGSSTITRGRSPLVATIVGLLTNWMALKCIFEPVEPVYLFFRQIKIQGLFLQRQLEVSGEFFDHLASKVLTSEKCGTTCSTARRVKSSSARSPSTRANSYETRRVAGSRLVGVSGVDDPELRRRRGGQRQGAITGPRTRPPRIHRRHARHSGRRSCASEWR